MRGWLHALLISSCVWMAIICSLAGRWELSLVWLVILAAHVTLLSVQREPPR